MICLTHTRAFALIDAVLLDQLSLPLLDSNFTLSNGGIFL